jgi:tripartite-type tricarboxylate transporter receptor subunit TctC
MLGRAAGIDLTLVPYRGGAPSITDLLGGHIPATVNPLAEVLPNAANGELRILLTMGTTRSRFAPEVPSAQEFGYRDLVFQDWSGAFAPVGTPPPLIGRAGTLVSTK